MPTAPPVALSALKRLEPSEVRLLWVNDWYDGPCEAVVEVANEPSLMLVVDPKDIGTDACRWVVFRLSPEERADERRWHELFVRHVGDHWCFHPDEPHEAAPGEADGPRDPELFYGPYRARTPFVPDGAAALGWLDRMPEG